MPDSTAESALTQDPPKDPLQQAHSAMTESALTQYIRFYNPVSTDPGCPNLITVPTAVLNNLRQGDPLESPNPPWAEARARR